MLTLSTTSRLKPREVIKKARAYFGGYGMKVTDEADGCVTMEGSGGGVHVSVCRDDNVTSVDIESREWDFQAKEFATLIK